ncbi:DUF1295 domain-containing protein [soil metagenome]
MILYLIIIAAMAILLYMSALFLISTALADVSIVDIFWGLGFIMVAIITAAIIPANTSRALLILILVLIWAIRLSLQIAIRKIGKPEDARYVKMRQDWGNNFLIKSYFYIFIIQGLALLIIAYPIILVNSTNQQPGITILDWVGVFLWIIGFLFETAADLQLYRFLKRPENRGKLLTSGVWKYSRHPNYFGEICIWWGIFFIALNAPWGLSAIISPLLITYLLLYVSGIPPAEHQLEANPAFPQYKETTNILIPWFPKK